jgi:hypothetical protein
LNDLWSGNKVAAPQDLLNRWHLPRERRIDFPDAA